MKVCLQDDLTASTLALDAKTASALLLNCTKPENKTSFAVTLVQEMKSCFMKTVRSSKIERERVLQLLLWKMMRFCFSGALFVGLDDGDGKDLLIKVVVTPHYCSFKGFPFACSCGP